jgi:XTP/dITP diphosphohydrolase
MEILLATENHHKKEEIQSILKDHTILIPPDIDMPYSHDETGTTYFENAYGKAHTLLNLQDPQQRYPVIADDSGLSVEAMDGAPGIYSARYGTPAGGAVLSDKEKYEILLQRMTGTANRNAFFVSCIVLMFSEYRFFSVQETINGSISEEPRGRGGFGYDPVFYVPDYGKTVAELSPEIKNSISHRAKSCRKINQLLEGVLT